MTRPSAIDLSALGTALAVHLLLFAIVPAPPRQMPPTERQINLRLFAPKTTLPEPPQQPRTTAVPVTRQMPRHVKPAPLAPPPELPIPEAPRESALMPTQSWQPPSPDLDAIESAEPALEQPTGEIDSSRDETLSLAQLTEYLSTVRSQVERRKTYPAFALRTGQQGSVTVRLTIDPQGRLLDLVLVSSSGFAAIDNAALTTVRAAGPFRPPLDFSLGLVIIDIPVVYRLS